MRGASFKCSSCMPLFFLSKPSLLFLNFLWTTYCMCLYRTTPTLIKRGRGVHTFTHKHVVVGRLAGTKHQKASTVPPFLLFFALLLFVKGRLILFQLKSPFKPLELSVQQSACQQIDSGSLNCPRLHPGASLRMSANASMVSLGAS